MTVVEPAESPVGEEMIPEVLQDCEQWICWREEVRDGQDKPTKIPVDPQTGSFASTTDPGTWTDFETARAYATEAADGLGFVFSETDDFVGVDLDACRDPETGAVGDIASSIIQRLDSYTEVSPSGTGFHVIVRGSLPGDRNRKGNVEVYEMARFFTVTGEHVSETPTDVHDRNEELAAVYDEFICESSEDSGGIDDSSKLPDVGASDAGSDDRTTEDLLEQARTAANGEKFRRLWNGHTTGYESHSEADMALCCLLAFWTRGDADWMDSLFRDSGLMRPKWDEVHYGDGSTYGSKTVQRAIARTSEFYEPEGRTESSDLDGPDGAEASAAPSDDEYAVQRAQTTSVYLDEQNRVLRARVRDQEATIERQAARLAELETELSALRATLADRGGQMKSSTDRSDPSSAGIVTRIRRRLWDDPAE
jgi:primase-polymerase (primpol)-like protein